MARVLWSCMAIAMQFFVYDWVKETMYDAILVGVN